MNLNRRHLLAIGAALTVTGPVMAQTLPRVLCFGDSLTAGYGLPREQGLVPQLAAFLQESGQPAQLINAGISGDTTYGGRVRIGISIRRHNPDAVMVELGGNDMLRKFAPDKAEQNLDAILSAASQGGRPVLLIGIHAPAGDATWRSAWSQIWSRLANRHQTLLLPDLYAPLAEVDPDQRAPFLQGDGIHPSPLGVQRIVGHLGPLAAQLVAKAA
ncbi:MAG: arylesterase [Paracoccus sp. (in: a-proteobacteria)]|nr:arylesterase [Paracoccus sp. (in: a-proteobacteria)]